MTFTAAENGSCAKLGREVGGKSISPISQRCDKVNTKKFGLLHHNSKIWPFEILPRTPSFSGFRLPFFVAVKVTPIKKVHKIDPPKSTTHYSMNIFSDPLGAPAEPLMRPRALLKIFSRT